MKYVSMAITGLIVGILARFVYPGEVPMGWAMSAILGVVGSFLAGTIGTLMDKQPGTQLKPAGFLWSLVGALVVIFVARKFGFSM